MKIWFLLFCSLLFGCSRLTVQMHIDQSENAQDCLDLGAECSDLAKQALSETDLQKSGGLFDALGRCSNLYLQNCFRFTRQAEEKGGSDG